MKIIDPSPAGWMYGFPKPYDNPQNIPIDEWVVQNGYPKHLVEVAVYRFWELTPE